MFHLNFQRTNDGAFVFDRLPMTVLWEIFVKSLHLDALRFAFKPSNLLSCTGYITANFKQQRPYETNRILLQYNNLY